LRSTRFLTSTIEAVGSGVFILFGLLMAALPETWIEEAVGFEPDGGNGTLEFTLVLVPIAIGIALAVHRLALRHRLLSPAPELE
jgi:hypothetical protein